MKKRIIIFTAVLISAVVLAVAAGVIVIRTLDLEAYRADLIKTVKTELNRDLRYARGEFSLWLRPAFTFTDVVVLEKDAQTIFIAVDRLSFKLSLLPLLLKKIVLREVALENPRIALIREADGAFNVSDLLDDRQQNLSFGISRLQIHNGFVHFTDRRIAPEPLTISLERINLRLSRLERGKTADFSLKATLVDAEKNGSIVLDGSIEIAKASEPLLNSRIDAAVKAGGLNADRYWPYYSRRVPFKKLAGRLDIDTRFRGTVKEFESGGSVTLHEVHFDYPPVFYAPLKPKMLHAVYEMKLDPRDIAVNRLDVSVDGVQIKGSCLLKDIHTDDPLIDAKAVTTEIPWESFNHYVPYGIIPKDAADFIREKIKAGIFRLDDGRLRGRVSQIAHMEKGDNSNALYIRGRAQKSVLEYAPDVPAITDITGILELKGKDFILREMTGKFGDAPFSLEGKLADYCLETPTRYPFTLKMTPTAKEVAWLSGEELAKKLHYAGTSAVRLSGDGVAANYNLSGAWDLSAADYKYSDWLAKPAGKANDLNFTINLSKQEIHFSSIRYNLSPLALTASARYRHTGKRALSLTIDTNPVQVGDLAPLLPKIKKYKPRGDIRLAARARSGPNDLDDLRWRGEIALTDVSFKIADHIKPVSNMTGKIHLRGDSLETAQMALQLGDSAISARGTIANLRDPSYAVTFGSERVDVADLGLQHPEQPVHIENVSGSVVFKNRDLQINALNFKINESMLNIRGAVLNVQDHPEARLDVASPYLDGQDLLILSGLKRAGKTGESSAKMSLNAAIRIDAGRMDRLSFEKLKTNLSLDENILYLKQTAVSTLGGTLAGNGRIDLADAGAPRYHFNFNLDKLSAEQCLQFFDVKEKLITGTFSAKGDLAAKGETAADLKKTALGNVQIRMEKGMLTRFAVLSKIFSILNVSQLLKFELPDMVRGGMPYDTIAATLSFKDGIVSTQDLFIRSDAMNISAVATIDMPRGAFVDTLVGVQPLQTVDKIVSLIPVVGWILTDENRSVVTVYFEVKGSLDNPAVTAIPVKAMARGVFDIFKNIFKLPARLFTDTGEVIFGR
ncbi:MAG: AsmA family protein [Syntrophus sp. (in: bacteria)]|nr:AsmA family protein [Syntrophus sp. (in: bacteria)]